jgi:hypothetical protein
LSCNVESSAFKAQLHDGSVVVLSAAQLDSLQQELSGAKEELLAKKEQAKAAAKQHREARWDPCGVQADQGAFVRSCVLCVL